MLKSMKVAIEKYDPNFQDVSLITIKLDNGCEVRISCDTDNELYINADNLLLIAPMASNCFYIKGDR